MGKRIGITLGTTSSAEGNNEAQLCLHDSWDGQDWLTGQNIREAHLRRKQENAVERELEEKATPIQKESTESADEVESTPKVDIFSLPKLYIRESELETYERDINMDSIQKNVIPVGEWYIILYRTRNE